MRGGLIFSRSGDTRRLYEVSPYLFPQYPALNERFLPDARELPEHGLSAQILVFDFGFCQPSLTVAPYDTQFFPVTLPNNFLGISITAVSDVPPSQNVVPALGVVAGVQQNPAFLMNIQHTHKGNTWQWFNKDVTNREGAGTAQNPLMCKSPVLVPAGDTLSAIVRNLSNASLRVQITLIGGAF